MWFLLFNFFFIQLPRTDEFPSVTCLQSHLLFFIFPHVFFLIPCSHCMFFISVSFPFFVFPFVSTAYLSPNAVVHFPIFSFSFFLSFFLATPFFTLLFLCSPLYSFSSTLSFYFQLHSFLFFLSWEFWSNSLNSTSFLPTHVYKKSHFCLYAQTPLGLFSELLPLFLLLYYCIPVPLFWV